MFCFKTKNKKNHHDYFTRLYTDNDKATLFFCPAWRPLATLAYFPR